MKQAISYIKKFITAATPKLALNLQPTIEILHLSQIKRVTKPWGFELWLSDASDTPYALKLIYLKKGTKTSLQLHRKKSEHNFIFSGKIKLYYEDTNKKIKSVKLGGGRVIKILPNTIHRIEALTEVLLIEASSHELDDVIRLEDDTNRQDGKIEPEHEQV